MWEEMKRHYATKEANTVGRTLLSAQVPARTVLAALCPVWSKSR